MSLQIKAVKQSNFLLPFLPELVAQCRTTAATAVYVLVYVCCTLLSDSIHPKSTRNTNAFTQKETEAKQWKHRTV